MGNEGIRVVVAMSGGVDSSVSAGLLVEQGYDVAGIMLKLWSEEGGARYNKCCTPADVATARSIADQLGIPFYLINIANTFKSIVVDFFVEEYSAGRTPNPCLECNRYIRFDLLLNKALGLGADFLATGHYARVRQDDEGRYQLLRGLDPQKDQSYALSVLGQKELAHTMFPIGEQAKSEVREHARRLNLPVAEKADSQDLCFLGNSDYRDFLKRHAADAIRPGEIRDTAGNTLGQHTGLPFYTIGQRKGLGISAAQPLYVLALDASDNSITVGTATELGRQECVARAMHYVSGARPTQPFRAMVKIRYKARAVAAMLYPTGDTVRVVFESPQRGVTPGQGLVAYDDETVVGQGIIT